MAERTDLEAPEKLFRTLVVKIKKRIPIPYQIFRKGSISPELVWILLPVVWSLSDV